MTLVKCEKTSAYCTLMYQLCVVWGNDRTFTLLLSKFAFWNKRVLSLVAAGCIHLLSWIGHCSLLPRREFPHIWRLCNFLLRNEISKLRDISREHNNGHVSQRSSPKFSAVLCNVLTNFSQIWLFILQNWSIHGRSIR